MGIYKPGDLFLVDSDSTEAKIVKFLMASDTIWHWSIGKIYEFITKKQAPDWLIRKQKYYHVGMIYNETQTIEQQGTVKFMDINRLATKPHAIIRRKNATSYEIAVVLGYANGDLGKGYDILLILGKTLTYLTGIPLFMLVLNSPNKELCVTRGAEWYWKTFNELWGRSNYNYVQTDDMYYYALAYPEVYEVYEYNTSN